MVWVDASVASLRLAGGPGVGAHELGGDGVAAGSSLLQPAPACSSLLQPAPADPACSSLLQPIQPGPAWSSLVQPDPARSDYGLSDLGSWCCCCGLVSADWVQPSRRRRPSCPVPALHILHASCQRAAAASCHWDSHALAAGRAAPLSTASASYSQPKQPAKMPFLQKGLVSCCRCRLLNKGTGSLGLPLITCL
jgi:hypothetical protein